MKDNPLNRVKVKRGTELKQAKLTEEKVREIRAFIAKREELKRLLKNMTNTKLAEKYGVHYRTIDRVSAEETWSHV